MAPGTALATADCHRLFLQGLPLADVRAPVEFAQGAFPGAVNLPLMNDAERHAVGLCFRQHGQQAAIALGHRLVAGPVKAERIAAWAAFAQAHPDGFLYCFRGGLRSHIAQQWLAEAGVRYPLITGGYKALRQTLIQTLEAAATGCGLTVLGGMTGTGKTDLLNQLAHGIDLEGHAHHRGSSFGAHPQGQPTQIDFENRLAIDLLRKRAAGMEHFVWEDEGRHIGRCAVPPTLRDRLAAAPLVWLEAPFEARVDRILRDYVVGQQAALAMLHGPEQALALLSVHLLQSLDKTAKRLGGERHRRIRSCLQDALVQHQAGDVQAHRAWIAALLQEYYDPMYRFQRQQQAGRIVFTGDAASVLDWLRRRG